MHQAGYPWLSAARRSLSLYLDAERVPQALLIHGHPGVGKVDLAEWYAQKLLCEKPAESACGHCPSCQLVQAGTHPDLKRASPDEPGRPIRVETIRLLMAELMLKSQYDRYRVVILSPAHLMNISSANALLKTLEEPPERLIFLLVSDRPFELPATILSRCQKLAIQTPSHAVAKAWLKTVRPDCAADLLLFAAEGSPLSALALSEGEVVECRQRVFEEFSGLLRGVTDPVSLAERWQAQAQDQIIEWLISWTLDLMCLVLGSGSITLRNPDLEAPLATLARSLDAGHLAEYWDSLLDARRVLNTQVNRQLMWEHLLIQGRGLGTGRLSEVR